jgi:integrase/recombinase XerD
MNLQQAVSIYNVCARAEGKSERTIEWVTSAVRYLGRFLGNEAADISVVNADCLRRFILALRQQPVYAVHRFNHVQKRPLSLESVSCYVRALKSLFALLTREGYFDENPIAWVKAPKVPIKEMPVFTLDEITRLLAQPDRTTPVGARNHTVMLTFLDTGSRVSELCGLNVEDVDFESGYLHLRGKGSKERLVPMGFKLTKILLKYHHSHHEKNTPGLAPFFTTENGERLTRNRVAKFIRDYGRQAGITGKRVSPHVFRSTKAVLYLRHGGDVFSLQKCLGHATLSMTRRYSAIADADVKAAHLKFGVIDRLKI